MKATTQTQLLGVSSINVDGKVYSSIFIAQPAELSSETSKGLEVMKVPCDADVFNSLPRDGAYPMDCTVELEFRKAAGGKMGQHCTKAAPVRANAKAS